MKEDAELLHAFATGRDEASFRELVDRRIGFVYAVNLRRLRDPHLAQDATQAVFIALARKAAKVAHGPSVIGWLHRSCCYESLNLMRAQTNRLARETEAERLGTTTGAARPPEAAGALEAVLDEILNELPEKDREIILARYFSDRSYAEIGAKTGYSENAARMRADRALARLRDRLESRGFPSAAAVLAGILPAYASAAIPSGLATVVANTALTMSAAGAASASVFFSMSATKIVTAAAVFVLAGFTGFEAYQANNLRRELGELRQQSLQASEKYRSLENRLAALQAQQAAPNGRAPATRMAEPAAPPPAAAGKPAPLAGVTRTAPAGWYPNGNNPKAFEVGVDPNQSFGGVASAYAKSLDDSAEKSFGGLGQAISADQYKNQRVRLTGWIKTEDANNGGGRLWLRVDGETRGQSLGFDNMEKRAPKGTTDWTEYSIVLDVPAEAKSLNYGFFLSGKGQMWVNGLNIEPVGPEIPTTNMITAPKPLPTAPVNPTFSPNPAPGG
ncbi:MAG TPA: sigma-70 family RNA polymerase sigma factor [Lacunisphaera sp.]|nr:sigma-70 family RNA polymerase sigma factor [Lacunisphaera sp.]